MIIPIIACLLCLNQCSSPQLTQKSQFDWRLAHCRKLRMDETACCPDESILSVSIKSKMGNVFSPHILQRWWTGCGRVNAETHLQGWPRSRAFHTHCSLLPQNVSVLHPARQREQQIYQQSLMLEIPKGLSAISAAWQQWKQRLWSLTCSLRTNCKILTIGWNVLDVQESHSSTHNNGLGAIFVSLLKFLDFFVQTSIRERNLGILWFCRSAGIWTDLTLTSGVYLLPWKCVKVTQMSYSWQSFSILSAVWSVFVLVSKEGSTSESVRNVWHKNQEKNSICCQLCKQHDSLNDA